MRTEPSVDPILSAVEMAEHRPQAVLIVFHEKRVEVATLAPGLPVVVGRDDPSDVCICDPRLSRVHARFALDGDRASTVEDLGSTNGTWIGERRVTKARIVSGQEVRMGSTAVRVQILGAHLDDVVAQDWSKDDALVAGRAMAPVLETAARVAAARIPVLLHGETGTGKEVLARFLHARGPRVRKPLVCVNCAAIPASLVESTLFGHEKGAFTGAAAQQRGVFEEAHESTVFLDEIGEISPAVQAALLRVLETGSFTRVGGTREIRVDARIVAATHRDLEAMSAQGTFRSDLYFRLSTLVLQIPPLRARKDEIPQLVARFLRRANEANGRSVQAVSPAAMAELAAYGWPGNIRELRNAIERAVVVACGDTIGIQDLPARVLSERPPAGAEVPASVSATEADSSPAGDAARATNPERPGAGDPADRDSPGDDATDPLPERVQRYERDIILSALESSGWRRAEAAKKLGIPLRTLAYRIKTLGVPEPEK